MRWPWQREQPAEAPPERIASAAVADRVPPSGWAFLPPLQRTIGSVQLTTDPGRFTGALPSWSDPSFTGRMAHLVSAQAPPGVIDVDGGGPVPADGGYPAGSGEMTLLPPAHGVRPVPAVFGSGVPTATAAASATVQRVTPDGGAGDGASPAGTETDGQDDGGGATSPREGAEDGGFLLAPRGATFPVLHVEPRPLQRSDSHTDAAPMREAAPMPLAPSLPDTAATEPAPFRPGAGMPAPGPGAEESIPSPSLGSDRPGRGGSSSSDGSATYVQIPSGPAVQRTLTGPADRAPSSGNGQRSLKVGLGAPRLGLGMPLSFSESSPEPAGSAEPPAGLPAGTFPLPVQRASTPGITTPPPAPVAPAWADAGSDNTVEEVLPDAGIDTAQEETQSTAQSTSAQSTSEQATTQRETTGGGTSDPPTPETLGAPDTPAQEALPDAGPSPAAETAISPLPEVASAPLLSAGSAAGTLDLASDRHPGEDGVAPLDNGTRPALPFVTTSTILPVVSRVIANIERADAGQLGHNSDLEDAPTEAPPNVASVPEPGYPLVAPSDDEPLASPAPTRPFLALTAAPPVTTEAVRPLLPGTGTAGAPGGGPATTLLQPGRPSLQHVVAGASATISPAEDHVHRTHLPSPTHVPGGGRPSDGPRSIPTSAGPVILRVVQSGGRDSRPETWQRLTALPVLAPPAARQPAPQAAGVERELASGGVAGPRLSATSAATGPSTIEPSAAVTAMPLVAGPGEDPGVGTSTAAGTWTDTAAGPGPDSAAADPGSGRASAPRAAEAPDQDEAAAFDAAAGPFPEPSAAVGRVIQRTMSLPAAPYDGTARASSAPSVRTLTRAPVDAPVSVPPANGARPHPASLQRSAVSGATYPAPRAVYAPWLPDTGGAGPAPTGFLTGFLTGQADAAVPGSGTKTPAPLALSLAVASPGHGQDQNTLQREEAELSAPDSVPAATTPASTSVPDGADGGLSGQGAELASTGPPGLPGPAAGAVPSGTAASGNTAQASPEQLEELAKRLAGPLIRRIKAEMLLDRERRGLRTDVN